MLVPRTFVRCNRVPAVMVSRNFAASANSHHGLLALGLLLAGSALACKRVEAEGMWLPRSCDL